MEQFYLDLFKPEYNLLQIAGSSLGVKRTEETLWKMSAAKFGENNPLFGKNQSEETRAKISASMMASNPPLL